MMSSYWLPVKSSEKDYDGTVLSTEENWFGPRVKAFRERAGISQLKLAEEMGVSLQTVREWERGVKFPHLRRLLLLAQVLGVEAGQFFPSTGYASKWPHNLREGEVAESSMDPKILARIDRHLSTALDEFRKIVRNQGT